MAKHREGRINEEIRKEISLIIQNDIRDPRLSSMISITSVDVTKDLRYAKVYVSLFGKEESNTNTFSALKSSSGFIRKELGRKISVRYIPELMFELDTSIEKGMHIDAILQEIKEHKDNDTK